MAAVLVLGVVAAAVVVQDQLAMVLLHLQQLEAQEVHQTVAQVEWVGLILEQEELLAQHLAAAAVEILQALRIVVVLVRSS